MDQLGMFLLDFELTIIHLELVYTMGYTGKYNHTLIHHPTDKNILIYAVGANIVIHDLANAHEQQFLDGGHDEDVCLIEISNSGRFVATTQLGSTKQKGNFATINVWDYRKRKLLFQINGHENSVHGLSFSHDDAFLTSAGNKRILLWSVPEGGEYAGGMALRGPGQFVKFLPGDPQKFNPARPVYEFVYADSKVGKCLWRYELRSMTFKLEHVDLKLPGRISGMRRTYTTCEISGDGRYGFVGTRIGEIMIFNLEHGTFDTSVLVVSNSVRAINVVERVTSNDDDQQQEGRNSNQVPWMVFVGGGDGFIRLLEKQYDWSVTSEKKLKGQVTSLSHSLTQASLFIGMDSGKIAELTSPGLDLVRVVCESHVSDVLGVDICDSCEKFCTASKDGDIFEWDLSNYGLSNVYSGSGFPCSIMYLDGSPDVILSGWSNGFIRCFVNNKGLDWKVVNAHRGAITHLGVNSVCICTAGEDGAIRIWRRKNRELVSQFSPGSVHGIKVDLKREYLIHSCGSDRSVYTYSLKVNRRVTYHTPVRDALCCMAQLVDGENEVVTGTITGKIAFWDIDYKDPVDIYSLVNEDDEKVKSEKKNERAFRINCVDVARKSGKFLVFGNESGEVGIVDLKKKCVIQRQRIHSKAVTKVKWSNDEKQIVSVASDPSVCVWNFYQ